MGRLGTRSSAFRLRSVRAGTAICTAILCAGPAAAQGFSSWAHSKDIYYDTSPDGAGVAGDVLAFPVLVRLTAADFPFAEARDSGQDIRFSKPDGSPLPFEIDVWDRAAGEAAVWVLADTIKGNHKGRLLRLHWGNPDAPAASAPGGVFSSANGFSAVWHLRGRYPEARRNAVPGGWDAVPANYDSDEETRGLIGYADSLDGTGAGDHLRTWQAFDDLSAGFTFSVWAYPSAVTADAKLMDFGNGPGLDNLALSRAGSTADLRFDVYHGATANSITAAGAVSTGEWQHFAVTVSGKSARIYRNGVLAAAGDLADTIAALRRGSNFLGRSNWSGDQPFRGKLDEPVVAKTARGADWIRLAYANQRPDQSLLSFEPIVTCDVRFGAPGDTAALEGGLVSLPGVADCADQFMWSIVDGPAVRILDPAVKTLDLALPRVAGDTAIVLRFTAQYGDSARSLDVRVSIDDAIPEPRFTLPAGLSWNGRDSLLIRPDIANLAAVAASSHPDLRYAWTLRGLEADSAWRQGGLLLLAAAGEGGLIVALCLDNQGPPECHETEVEVGTPVGAGRAAAGPGPAAPDRGGHRPGFGADGRYRSGSESPVPRYGRPGAASAGPGRPRR